MESSHVQLKNLVESHIKFLHDLSSPLMVAFGTLETLLNESKEMPNPAKLEDPRLKRVMRAIEKMAGLLKEEKANLKIQLKELSDRE